MLSLTYYAQNYAGIIDWSLLYGTNYLGNKPVSYVASYFKGAMSCLRSCSSIIILFLYRHNVRVSNLHKQNTI